MCAINANAVKGRSYENVLHDNLSYESFFTRKFPDLHYKKLFYKLQIAVQRKRTELLEQMHSIEKDYHGIHGNLPQDNSSEYAALMVTCKHISCYKLGT